MTAFIAKFYELIIYVLLILLFCALVWGGWQKYKRNQADYKVLNAEILCQEEIGKQLKPYLDAEKQGQKNANEAAKNYEQQKEVERSKTETITHEVQKIVERPIYINTDCFDDDGVHFANEAGDT
jgi:hypothetical protein